MNDKSIYFPVMAREEAETDPSGGRIGQTNGPRRRGRGRRPEAEVRADVLAAAGALLLEQGMAGFTIEGVAARAGASKTTIYKWWESKGALALDGYFHAVEETLAFPDTGVIAEDLLAQLRAFVRLVSDTPAGRVIAELVGEAQTDPALADALHRLYTGPRIALAVEAMERAQTRGQLRKDIELEAVVDQLWGACYHRMLLAGQPLDEAYAAKLVSNLMNGIQPARSGRR
jgi:AcrR family transcriptional regulator